MNKWDLRFLGLASCIGSWSKDPSTQVGAVIVRPNNTICSTGYNGAPKGMSDVFTDRVGKLQRTIHAEMNALIYAPEPVVDYTIYVTPCPPCDRCTVHLIQAGIKRIVAFKPTPDMLKRWDFKIAQSMAEEAGVLWETC